jgi:hypothetical protein
MVEPRLSPVAEPPRVIDANPPRSGPVVPADSQAVPPPNRVELPEWTATLRNPQVLRPLVGVVIGMGLLSAAYAGGFFGLWACFCCGVIGFILGSMTQGPGWRV